VQYKNNVWDFSQSVFFPIVITTEYIKPFIVC
jgi:hypothetical protein